MVLRGHRLSVEAPAQTQYRPLLLTLVVSLCILNACEDAAAPTHTMTDAAVPIPGPQGSAGPQGPEGSMGLRGPPGEPGTPGTVGAPGPMGPPGSAGVIGPIGPAGPAGAPGAPGQQGAIGPRGPVGAAGSAGPPGVRGPEGPPGVRGPEGPPGAAGAAPDLAHDGDMDGIPDWLERLLGTDPGDGDNTPDDEDGDGLPDALRGPAGPPIGIDVGAIYTRTADGNRPTVRCDEPSHLLLSGGCRCDRAELWSSYPVDVGAPENAPGWSCYAGNVGVTAYAICVGAREAP